jgi:hypothetical protein
VGKSFASKSLGPSLNLGEGKFKMIFKNVCANNRFFKCQKKYEMVTAGFEPTPISYEAIVRAS